MKSKIREDVIQQLKKLSETPIEKEKREETILLQLFSSELWKNSEVVGVTLAMPFEFNTKLVIEKALKEGKKVCIPKTFPNRKMSFYYHDFSEKLELSKFGVLEPTNDKEIEKSDIDLLIVPGVAFNNQGYRIGFGGGFYDRYLADFRGETCSLVFSEQLATSFKPDTHDLPVNKIFKLEKSGGVI